MLLQSIEIQYLVFSAKKNKTRKLKISVQFIEFLTEFCFVRKNKIKCIPGVQKKKNSKKPEKATSKLKVAEE
jgi:hypothetical protein